jgi:hypothetical protein
MKDGNLRLCGPRSLVPVRRDKAGYYYNSSSELHNIGGDNPLDELLLLLLSLSRQLAHRTLLWIRDIGDGNTPHPSYQKFSRIIQPLYNALCDLGSDSLLYFNTIRLDYE